MIFNGRLDSGEEDWSCPACGRRELMRWPPKHGRRVVEPGDTTVFHVGGRGGVRIASVTLQSVPAVEVPDAERRWLRDNGIGW